MMSWLKVSKKVLCFWDVGPKLWDTRELWESEGFYGYLCCQFYGYVELLVGLLVFYEYGWLSWVYYCGDVGFLVAVKDY